MREKLIFLLPILLFFIPKNVWSKAKGIIYCHTLTRYKALSKVSGRSHLSSLGQPDLCLVVYPLLLLDLMYLRKALEILILCFVSENSYILEICALAVRK